METVLVPMNLEAEKRCNKCGKTKVLSEFYKIKSGRQAMDFDHIDPKKKVNNVSSMLGRNIDCLVLEILKCEVVCSNCHRVRSYNAAG